MISQVGGKAYRAVRNHELIPGAGLWRNQTASAEREHCSQLASPQRRNRRAALRSLAVTRARPCCWMLLCGRKPSGFRSFGSYLATSSGPVNMSPSLATVRSSKEVVTQVVG